MHAFADGAYRICEWIMRFAYLNILWLLFMFMGLVAFGLMPATASMFAIVRKWQQGNVDIPILKTFWNIYRKDFLKTNILGYTLLLIGYILYIQFQILRAQESSVYWVVSYAVLVLGIGYLIMLMYVFPIFVHFHVSILQNIKWSIIIGLVHPILTILLIISIVVVGSFLYSVFPSILFFFGGSVTAFVLMWGASKTFGKYEIVT